MDFTDKNVIITGSSRGLGCASALAFAKAGANVALLGRNSASLQEVATQIPKEQFIDALTLDLSKPDEIATAYHKLVQHIAHVDILINNAAGWIVGSLEQTSDEAISSLVATSITGSLLITKHLLPLLKKSDNSHIINIISTSGLPNYSIDPSIASVPYFAAKWGQAGFSEALRGEVEKEGVRVSSVYPGSFSNTSSLDDSDASVKERYGEGIMGVKDVVDALLFCASRGPNANIHSLTITP